MKTSLLWWSLSAAALSSAAFAQGPAPQSAVSGIVFDSVAKRPLAGAIVQAIMVDSLGGAVAATATTSVTDTSGQFRVSGLRRGSFLIGFQHSALVVLGLESPLRSFRIESDTTLALDLAIPSGATVRARRCPSSAADDGMVTGLILDAAQGSPAREASVTLGWVELQSVKGQLRSVPQRVTAPVGEDGTYVVCGLPSDAPLTLLVSQPGYIDVFGEISVARGDLLRRDVRLVDTSAVRVGNVLRGRVQHPDGSTLASGRAVLSALDVEATVEHGEFTLPGVPAGTWALEVRAIGYEPQMALVDVTEGAGTVLVTVGRPVQLLEAVTVIGRLSRNAKVLREISERGRLSRGTQFFAGAPFMATAFLPSQVIRLARGFSSSGPRGCAEPGVSGSRLKQKHMAVYVDDFLSLDDLWETIPMQDIMAIETYPDAMSVPMKWRHLDVCAAIAIWTKH